MNDEGGLEERLNRVEDELAKPENQLKTGQIVARLFRYWIEEHWEPHNQSERTFRASIDRYLWGLRIAVAAVAAIGGVMAWALHTVLDVLQILKIGSGGP